MARYQSTATLPQYPHLSENLPRLRRERGLTQQALAARAKRPQSRISELERGARPRGEDEIRALAEALGVSRVSLLSRHIAVAVPEFHEVQA